MTRTDFKTVDDCIAVQPKAAQTVLGIVRRQEVISYKSPPTSCTAE